MSQPNSQPKAILQMNNTFMPPEATELIRFHLGSFCQIMDEPAYNQAQVLFIVIGKGSNLIQKSEGAITASMQLGQKSVIVVELDNDAGTITQYQLHQIAQMEDPDRVAHAPLKTEFSLATLAAAYAGQQRVAA
jgi:hypothetical protein